VAGALLWTLTWHSQRELQQLTDTSGASGHQKLRVCEVCGAYLSVLDSDRRLADHFGGKVRWSGREYICIFFKCSDRCTWDTTSLGICWPSSKRNARRRKRAEGEVWLRLLDRERLRHRVEWELARVNTDRRGMSTESESETGDMNDTRHGTNRK
jgi:hypothetical protein